MAHAGMTEAVGGEVGRPPRRHQLLASIEHTLGMLVEIPAALLVVAEVGVALQGDQERRVAQQADLVDDHQLGQRAGEDRGDPQDGGIRRRCFENE